LRTSFCQPTLRTLADYTDLFKSSLAKSGPAAATIADEVEIEIRISGQRQVWAVVPEAYPGDRAKRDAAADALAA